jgi:hypothetical protein
LVGTEPNWSAPSLHLYKGLVKVGSVKAIMVVSSTTILEQIARFFILLSDALSYWFSPKEPNKDNGDDKITALAPPALLMALLSV